MNAKGFFTPLWGAVAVLLLTCSAKAGMFNEVIDSYYPPTTVSVSTSAWTRIPAELPNHRRVGMFVNLPATDNANMVGMISDCAAATYATTIRPLEFIKGNESVFIPLGPSACLYMLSLHSSAESVHVQEVR